MVGGNFKEIWVVDFEFRSGPGERPEPVCVVAHEVLSGKILKLWGDDLIGAQCPYSVGSDSLFVAYYASAEMSCHLALDWPLPENVLDLYTEFRVKPNGTVLASGQIGRASCRERVGQYV